MKGHRHHLRQTHSALVTSFTLAGVVAAMSFAGATSPLQANVVTDFWNGAVQGVTEAVQSVTSALSPSVKSPGTEDSGTGTSKDSDWPEFPCSTDGAQTGRNPDVGDDDRAGAIARIIGDASGRPLIDSLERAGFLGVQPDGGQLPVGREQPRVVLSARKPNGERVRITAHIRGIPGISIAVIQQDGTVSAPSYSYGSLASLEASEGLLREELSRQSSNVDAGTTDDGDTQFVSTGGDGADGGGGDGASDVSPADLEARVRALIATYDRVRGPSPTTETTNLARQQLIDGVTALPHDAILMMVRISNERDARTPRSGNGVRSAAAAALVSYSPARFDEAIVAWLHSEQEGTITTLARMLDYTPEIFISRAIPLAVQAFDSSPIARENAVQFLDLLPDEAVVNAMLARIASTSPPSDEVLDAAVRALLSGAPWSGLEGIMANPAMDTSFKVRLLGSLGSHFGMFTEAYQEYEYIRQSIGDTWPFVSCLRDGNADVLRSCLQFYLSFHDALSRGGFYVGRDLLPKVRMAIDTRVPETHANSGVQSLINQVGDAYNLWFAVVKRILGDPSGRPLIDALRTAGFLEVEPFDGELPVRRGQARVSFALRPPSGPAVRAVAYLTGSNPGIAIHVVRLSDNSLQSPPRFSWSSLAILRNAVGVSALY